MPVAGVYTILAMRETEAKSEINKQKVSSIDGSLISHDPIWQKTQFGNHQMISEGTQEPSNECEYDVKMNSCCQTDS